MAAAAKLAHTTFTQLYARRVPHVMAWGAGILAFLCWPHIAATASNKAHHVPNINTGFF